MASFTEIVNPEGLSWELIVVDNNSQDKTRAICEEYKKEAAWDLRYVFEEKQGLSQARNRGRQHAQGDIVAFTDDDVIVDKYWLFNIHKVFSEYRVAAVGGRILPLWDTPKPRWLIPDLFGMLALLDLGGRPIYLTSPSIYGANFAVRAEMFRKYGAFNINLGRIGKRLSCHEEYDFLLRLHHAGEKILYHPNVLVHHCISRERMSKSYFRRWRYYAGASSAVMQKNVSRKDFWKMSGYRAKGLLLNVLLYIVNLLCFSAKRFVYELAIINDVSFFWHSFVVSD